MPNVSRVNTVTIDVDHVIRTSNFFKHSDWHPRTRRSLIVRGIMDEYQLTAQIMTNSDTELIVKFRGNADDVRRLDCDLDESQAVVLWPTN